MSDENANGEIIEYDVRPMTKEEKIGAGIVSCLVVGFVGLVAWAGYKQEQREAEANREALEQARQRKQERIDWMNEESELGNHVYSLHDGTYLVVPRSAEGVRTVVK